MRGIKKKSLPQVGAALAELRANQRHDAAASLTAQAGIYGFEGTAALLEAPSVAREVRH